MTDVYGIVGPTASGKTELSLCLAEALSGEILCMDSMQVYRGMDIGTAKATADERRRVLHHLLDLKEPDEPFSVAEWAELARKLIVSVPCPILTGGTGLYLSALDENRTLGHVGSDESLRAEFREYAARNGSAALHRLLAKADPAAAAKIHPNDLKRIVRALEIIRLTGLPLSAQRDTHTESPYRFHLFAADVPRPLLYERISRRVDDMVRDGLEAEVRGLYERGIPKDCQAIQGIGYKEWYDVFDGLIPREEGIFRIKLSTRRYAKRQLTWFRRDERITWLPMDTPENLTRRILTLIRNERKENP